MAVTWSKVDAIQLSRCGKRGRRRVRRRCDQVGQISDMRRAYHGRSTGNGVAGLIKERADAARAVTQAAAIASHVQYAALPYRVDGSARTEIMLITSRERRRWIIPKGWPHKGRAPHRSAAREAFEEAGVVGKGPPTPGRHVLLPQAAQERLRHRMRGAGVRAAGAAPEPQMAREGRTRLPMDAGGEGGEAREGPASRRDHPEDRRHQASARARCQKHVASRCRVMPKRVRRSDNAAPHHDDLY